MPESYMPVLEEELTYVNGGYVFSNTGSVGTLKAYSKFYMDFWKSRALNKKLSTLTMLPNISPIINLPSFGSVYCLSVAKKYQKAYDYFSGKFVCMISSYALRTHISSGQKITDVTYGKA